MGKSLDFGKGETFLHTFAVLHDPQDGMVGLLHTLLSQHTYIGDGVVYGSGYDAFAATEFFVMEIHPISHDACIYCGGDLSGTGGLGTVANGSRKNGYRIDNGVGNGTVAAT